MSQLQKERDIVRELAKEYREIAHSDRYVRMRKRFLDTNNLKVVRPPLIMEELPWHELYGSGELDCLCETDWIRDVEYTFRMALFRHRHFACDNYIEPEWKVFKRFSVSSNGLEIREKRLAVDDRNGVVSHHYTDILEDEETFDRLFRPQTVTPYPDWDKATVTAMEELLGDILPVRLCGAMTYYTPWDNLAMLRGVEPILTDMYDRPEYLHHIMERYTENMRQEIAQMRALGLYGPGQTNIHCTPAAVTYPEDDGKVTPTGEKIIPCWFRTMAQMFSTISPKMHYEFDMAYSVPLSEEFAYTYYGCCEPLDDRLEFLFRYKNLRKVGCTPWANVRRMAEGLQGRYVLSRKPNPAFVAGVTDTEAVRREISETAEACLRNGTPCDITLKDISTVNYRPENLVQWAKTASGVLDYYYGEA